MVAEGLSIYVRSRATTGGPNVMLGTKWPSMMSTWNHNTVSSSSFSSSFSFSSSEGGTAEGLSWSLGEEALVALVASNRAAQVGPRFAWSAERMEGAMIVSGGGAGGGGGGGGGGEVILAIWENSFFFFFFSFFKHLIFLLFFNSAFSFFLLVF